jgi:endonuclease YncB( thermonuclease family)
MASKPVWLACTALVGLAVLLLAGAAHAETVRAIDGDTLAIGREHIRLYGIDAPESRQDCERGGVTWHCGLEAKRALVGLLRAGEPDCRPMDRDRYGRTVAVCTVNGVDLGGELVREGLALAYRRYGLEYVGLEDEARVAHRGMWAGEFTAPWDWRQEHRR